MSFHFDMKTFLVHFIKSEILSITKGENIHGVNTFLCNQQQQLQQ